MSDTRRVYCGAEIQYADPTTTATTATKMAARPPSCFGVSVDVSFLK
jgi:hypothetical protein